MEEDVQSTSEEKLYPTNELCSLLNMHRSTASNKIPDAVKAGWLEEDGYR